VTKCNCGKYPFWVTKCHCWRSPSWVTKCKCERYRLEIFNAIKLNIMQLDKLKK
jgi:hypothetical protein